MISSHICTCDLCQAQAEAPHKSGHMFGAGPLPEGWAVLTVTGPDAVPSPYALQQKAMLAQFRQGFQDLAGELPSDTRKVFVSSMDGIVRQLSSLMQFEEKELRELTLHVCPACQQGPVFDHLRMLADLEAEDGDQAAA
ncbi:MAG: hypothetical protein CMD39_07250 [Gammaproteobacteria bacterium]|nr:hypothetical protein [Gammaproteobacteria bacterium]